jgi:SAM-dependent methyltransferase
VPDHTYEAERFVYEELKRLDVSGKSILDVGCGKGRWPGLIRADVPGGEDAYLIGVDLDINALRFCKKNSCYDDLIRCDVRKLPCKVQSLDYSLAFEVIEHIPKGEGIDLLLDLDSLSREEIVLTTPNGFLPTPSSSYYHIHRSGWNAFDLRKRGYTVRGYGSLIGNRLLPFLPRVAMATHYFLTPFAYIFPSIGGFLVAVKTTRKPGKTVST